MTEEYMDSVVNEMDYPVLNESEEKKISTESIPDELPILPLKNTVLFPGVVIPITVGRDKSIHLVKDAFASPNKIIGVTTQRNPNVEDPARDDLYMVGTVAQILRRFKMPDGSITIVIQGRSRFEISEFTQELPYYKARVSKLKDLQPSPKESKALMLSLKQEAGRIIELSPNIPTEAKGVLQNISSLSFLIHFIASNLNVEVGEKQGILENNLVLMKGESVLGFMAKELAVLELSEEIQSKVRTDLDKQQREYFLRQQMRTIQDELGEEGEGDIEGLKARGAKKQWPEKVQKVFEKEVAKLSRLNPNMPDYAVVMNYVEWLLDLPWQSYAETNFNFQNLKDTLETDHYGLEKVKERILEHLAVLKLRASDPATANKAPILCFYGPPGVGKTSLGRSIAKALDREYLRISLGGVRDEAEIRGHRRTYIGAMPGRIIQGLKKAKSGNPVFILDEIDKVGNDFRGDPSSALLEVLDPEQNFSFQDHYLEVEYDLSPIMFIATANSLDSIHPALRDRMEIIEINGYSLEEKLEIAKRHLIPKLKKEHGLKPAQLKINDKALRAVIDGFTRESGVRKLSQQIASLCRGAAKEIVMKNVKSVSITPANLESYLGIARFEADMYTRSGKPGVSIGLAWTPVGGDILFLETSLTLGSGRLSMTGQLGDVMKESATLAYTWVKSHAEELGIPFEVFRHWDIHVHCPAGAIPKDGPSAGTAMMTAITSAFTQHLVRPNLAMTGEITLRGKVLPVGGIKEKILAAKRAGIKTVLLPKENRKDVSEIKAEYLAGLSIVYVEEMSEVLNLALEKKVFSKAENLLAPEKIRLNLHGSGSVPFKA